MAKVRWVGLRFYPIKPCLHEAIIGMISARIAIVTGEWHMAAFTGAGEFEREEADYYFINRYYNDRVAKRIIVDIFDKDSWRIGFGELIEPSEELITMDMIGIFRIHFLRDTKWIGELPLEHLGIWEVDKDGKVSRCL
ncbi:MAG: hypothetical protein UX16_C0022G0008 [Parcubacteria group bacterium GW2011_GWB1_45_7]|nr:MAG: hypothetical protein UX16_C0022G0008 [Parcubacteria group bacterium GW2011_GWB1_45_7]